MRRIMILAALLGMSLPLADRSFGQSTTATRKFIGSFSVAAFRMPDAIKFLKSKGFDGVFVPEGAAPHTLLFRGTKADFEAANDALDRYLHPEWFQPRKPIPKKEVPKESAEDCGSREDKKVGASPLQKELLVKLRKESAERWAAALKANAGKAVNLMEKGAEHNVWVRKQYQTILTRDQYRIWAPSFAEFDLDAEHKLPAVGPGAKKSDETILARLGLSTGQATHLTKIQKDIATERRGLAFLSDARIVGKRTAELDQRLREALEFTLTEKQLGAFRAYWGAK